MLHDPTHLFEGEITPSQWKAARIISFITQPQLFSVVLFAIVCLACNDWQQYAVVYGICLFFGCIFPIIEVMYYSKKFNNDDGDVIRKEDRIVPLILGVISYILGCISLWLVSAPNLVLVLFICYATVTFAILLITPRWKISVHACGMIGPGMAITYLFFPWGLLIYISVPFICWARWVLRKHTPAQMAGGIILGFTITAVMFYLML